VKFRRVVDSIKKEDTLKSFQIISKIEHNRSIFESFYIPSSNILSSSFQRHGNFGFVIYDKPHHYCSLYKNNKKLIEFGII
jgi:hypothetical protein